MKHSEVVQQRKAEALNAIRALYHPLAKPLDCYYTEGETQQSCRENKIEEIIINLEKELNILKDKKRNNLK